MPISVSDIKNGISALVRWFDYRRENNALKSENTALKHENAALKTENQSLKTIVERERQVQYREPYCYRSGDERPMCPKCWQQDHKAVYMGQQQQWNGGLRRVCMVCSWHHYDEPPK